MKDKSNYYCCCKSLDSEGKIMPHKLHETEVNENDYCVHCDYAALYMSDLGPEDE